MFVKKNLLDINAFSYLIIQHVMVHLQTMHCEITVLGQTLKFLQKTSTFQLSFGCL